MGLSLCQNPVFIFIKESIYQTKMDCVKPTQETNKPTTHVFSTSVTIVTDYSVWVSFLEIVANTINSHLQ